MLLAPFITRPSVADIGMKDGRQLCAGVRLGIQIVVDNCFQQAADPADLDRLYGRAF
ncbi:hypothetical protein [Bradyrhizobium icense]|uniref:hypothetical protein n=1 Tax=Bradyrhizobium icense TaxID=1274631 RepID=UPI0012EA3F48|nr:hypothetical protein [Bradyrhizobium icense]